MKTVRRVIQIHARVGAILLLVAIMVTQIAFDIAGTRFKRKRPDDNVRDRVATPPCQQGRDFGVKSVSVG